MTYRVNTDILPPLQCLVKGVKEEVTMQPGWRRETCLPQKDVKK